MELSCRQTVLLRRSLNGKLENLLRVQAGDLAGEARAYLDGEEVFRGGVRAGEAIACWIPEPAAPRAARVRVEADGEVGEAEIALRVPRHWEVHLVQMSHHDPGYTDLMSHVFQRHYEWIDRLLDDMDARDGLPEDTRLRVAVEQFWSMEYFLNHAPKERAEKALSRIRSGDIELTALYANLITEQLGHEECYRALYPAEALAKECGVSITSAVHNDIPGVSWGLCRALCDAGIRFFAPDFPNYYAWGEPGLVSFWDAKAAFGHEGPGACRWRSPDGKTLLMWSGNGESGGGCNGRFPWLEEKLEQLETQAWPYDMLRATVGGGTVDNPCFIPDYADNATAWNEKYAYPHVVTSTNERFRATFEARIAERGITLPELAGDMPGQDYPVAAMSMAQITSAARKTHAAIAAAEKLLALTCDDPVARDQTPLLRETYRDLLLSDDHAYGYHFPAGPAMRASYWEKGSYAMRAEANAQDLLDKAMASVADRIAPGDATLRLVVFNACGLAGSRPVEAPMREMDNCGTIIRAGNKNPEIRTGYLLNNRRHVSPGPEYWQEGRFDLVDMRTGASVPYQLDAIEWDDPSPYAPEKCGLGAGTRRYGFFELPGGLRKVLRFVADDLPAFGYRCYALIPTDAPRALTDAPTGDSVENGVYRVGTDAHGICSVADLRTGRELLDPACPHRLGMLLTRTGRDPACEVMRVTEMTCRQGAVRSVVEMRGIVDGAHEVRVRLTLWRGIDRIELAAHLLRSAKPIQTMFMAFPFAGKGFRYQGMLCDLTPVVDAVPGAQSDMLTVGDCVAVGESGVLWSSADTAVASLGHLWPGYISTAHSCVMTQEIHNPLTEDAFDTGWIYAMLLANNFGTNFMCAQSFDGVYRFSFGACDDENEANRALWGEREQTPVATQFTDRSRGEAPAMASLWDADGLHCLTLKKAEDGRGFVARLWNHRDEPAALRLTFRGRPVRRVTLCDALERDIEGTAVEHVPPRSVVTVRFDDESESSRQ